MTNLFPKPKMKGDWAIFNDVTLNPFNSPWGCVDTVNAKCLQDKNAEECLDFCRKNKDCDAGYYIEFD